MFEGFVDDVFEEFHAIVPPEWREAAHHLVDEAPQAPPVDLDPVPSLLDDFWSQVFWSAAYGHCCLVVTEDLRESKVGQFDVACLVDDDIFGFEAAYKIVYSR